MKIWIYTHRLGDNYGGILQAYALQAYVKKLTPRTEVVTSSMHRWPSFAGRVKASLLRSIKSKKVYINTASIDRYVMRHTRNFIANHINTSPMGNEGYKKADLLIVGSDQVWRAAHVDPVNYMFGFVGDESIKRISYAASFGLDNVQEYSAEQLIRTAELAKLFEGISVREESGTSLVKENWGVDSLHHVDPTLLLDALDYDKVIRNETTREIEGSLFVYVLDRSEINNKIINKVESLSKTKHFELLPSQYRSLFAFLHNKDAYVLPKVEQWLRSFRDADYVVTDSFHGTVFSIIFNKPFISVGNKERGLARFISLLSIFGLQGRLVTSPEEITKKLVDEKINWTSVNEKIKKEQKRSEEYLRKYIQ